MRLAVEVMVAVPAALREAKPSCTEAVRAALRAANGPLTLTCLRLTLGNQWPAPRLSSALSKLKASGEIEVLPPERRRRRGHRYVAKACRVRAVKAEPVLHPLHGVFWGVNA